MIDVERESGEGTDFASTLHRRCNLCPVKTMKTTLQYGLLAVLQ
jgi:hypothetical protein